MLNQEVDKRRFKALPISLDTAKARWRRRTIWIFKYSFSCYSDLSYPTWWNPLPEAFCNRQYSRRYKV